MKIEKSVNEIIEEAIKLKRKLQITYDENPVICNPHVHGIMGGENMINAPHSGGFSESKMLGKSKSNWRNYELKKISSISMLDDNFSVESGYNPKDSRWEKVFCRI